jgi:hypothetical protein
MLMSPREIKQIAIPVTKEGGVARSGGVGAAMERGCCWCYKLKVV